MNCRPIFVGGTASHAGKSWLVTAICRYLRGRGVRVAPFKAQNMSNNSCACPGGGEIGRAQAVQAEACGLDPVTDMNPILLKPNSEMGCQVVLDGKVWRNLSARAYYEHFEFLFDEAVRAYERLAATYECVVIEGAGSVAEVNLASRDLANLAFAERVGAPAMLVADIDRGGVFASLAGTMCVVPEQHKPLIRSFVVNRFRGDPSLFQDGVDWLQTRTGRRCLGVMPYLSDVRIEEEDGVALDRAGLRGAAAAIVKLPHISNFTDFDLLAEADWVSSPNRTLYDVVVLPGTKNTTGDLRWLRSRGLDSWVLRQHAAGATVIGICGGYQMLGTSITEDGASTDGLGLLPVRTTMRDVKTVRSVRAALSSGHSFHAYEIHMGETEHLEGAVPFAYVDGRPEGMRHGRCVGTYLHGATQDAGVLRELGVCGSERVAKTLAYDRLGEWFAAHADTRLFEELYL